MREVSAGPALFYVARNERMVFLGAGVSVVSAEVEGSGSDIDYGGYVHCGVWWGVKPPDGFHGFELGVRYTFGADFDSGGAQRDVDGLQLYLKFFCPFLFPLW